jgi:subtilase family serine protease
MLTYHQFSLNWRAFTLPANRIFSLRFITRTFIILPVVLLAITGFGSGIPKAAAAGTADLIVQSITMTPQDPAIGDTVTITVTVKNQGTADAGQHCTACYVDNDILETRTVYSLNAGVTATLIFNWTAEVGSHIIRVTADSTGVIYENDETNNTRAFNFSTLAPDITVQSVTWAPQTPSEGDNVVFTATVKNQGNIQSKTTTAALYIGQAKKDTQNLVAINPGSTAVVTFNWIAAAGQSLVEVTVDENNANTESDETNNTFTAALAANPPDLTIQNVTWTPQSPLRGELVTFTVTVKNQGTGRAEACQFGYYIDSVFVTAVPISAIEAGATRTVTFTWTATALPDTHNLKVVIDYQAGIAESDETNNEYSCSISPVTPDLIIKNITWTPQTAGIGDLITFTVTIKNQGAGKAAASRVAYYISGEYQGQIAIPQLEAGGETTTSFTWTAEYSSITVMVTADSANIVTESNESNNLLTISVPIVLPDLIISNITGTPATPAVGDTVIFTVTVKNQGGGKADSYNIGYYLDGSLLDSDVIYATAAGASANTTFTWTAQNGRHVIKAVADCSSRLTESNENNNDYSVTVTPLMPDIAITNVTWTPLDTPVGAEVTFNVFVQNLGTLQAGSSRLTFYVDGTDSGFTYISSLDPGATVTEPFTWTATPGSHTIKVAADTNDEIQEIDEANNIKVVSLPPPDLIMQDVTYSPSDAAMGETVTVTATISNQGSSQTQASSVALYVDDKLYTTVELLPVDAGKTVTASLEWAAKADTHTLKVTADPDNSVIESDETNNSQEIKFATMTPDLAVRSFTWDTNDLLTSNEVNFKIIVENTGTGAAGESRLVYAIDSTSPVAKDLPAIPAGTATELKINTILAAGSHKVTVTVDTQNSVVELNEANNQRSFTFSTLAADLVIRSVTWTPLNANIGDTITITAKVENQGVAKAVNPRVDLLVNGTAAGSVTVPVVDISSTATVNFSWQVLEGNFEFSVLADAGNIVTESNKDNNVKTRSITFTKAVPPETRPVTSIAGVAPANKGFLNNWWWLLMIIAAGLGIGAFVSMLKTFRKKY